jgi:hypothetical protein
VCGYAGALGDQGGRSCSGCVLGEIVWIEEHEDALVVGDEDKVDRREVFEGARGRETALYARVLGWACALGEDGVCEDVGGCAGCGQADEEGLVAQTVSGRAVEWKTEHRRHARAMLR